MCVSLGLVLGVCPVYGCPTLLCGLAAILLRLNFPAIQLVNYLSSPLQVILLVPFIRLGALLFPGAPDSAGSHADAWHAVYGFLMASLHAVAAWFCVCAPAGFILYVCLVGALRRKQKRLCPTLS